MLVKSKTKTNTHITDTKPHLHIKLSDREHPSLLMILLTNFFSKLIKHCIFCTNKDKNQIPISDKLVYHFPLENRERILKSSLCTLWWLSRTAFIPVLPEENIHTQSPRLHLTGAKPKFSFSFLPSGVQSLSPGFFLRGWVSLQQYLKPELTLGHWVRNPRSISYRGFLLHTEPFCSRRKHALVSQASLLSVSASWHSHLGSGLQWPRQFLQKLKIN